jgi:hypothetical protein
MANEIMAFLEDCADQIPRGSGYLLLAGGEEFHHQAQRNSMFRATSAWALGRSPIPHLGTVTFCEHIQVLASPVGLRSTSGHRSDELFELPLVQGRRIA